MSIASLASDEILRTDRRKLNLSPMVNMHLDPVIESLGLDSSAATQLRTAAEPLAAETPVEKNVSSNTLDGLVKYIPTESITLYVAATAAMPSFGPAVPLSAIELYWGFVALTPILFLLIYIGKRRSQKLPFLPESWTLWPWWKLIASTIAFMVWALAIPPLVTTDGGKVAAGFGALLVSTLLSLIGGIVEPSD